MKQAIIDIGSNSMRLTVYETQGTTFRTLFREKIMAGLAGYVENGVLSGDGIDCACTGLLAFRDILQSLDIPDCTVFATASLRNIQNTVQAVTAIEQATGFQVEIISGEEEAMCGYTGAMREINLPTGAFVDIGGASTEVVTFRHRMVLQRASFEVGSLKLYRECVKKILPGLGGLKRIQNEIDNAISPAVFPFEPVSTLVCAGGTARAVLKLAKKVNGLPADYNRVTAQQLYDLAALLGQGDKAAADLILRLEPDRIHTMVPGVMILQHICRQFGAEELVVCKYGVREGYLCRRILKETTPKTGN